MPTPTREKTMKTKLKDKKRVVKAWAVYRENTIEETTAHQYSFELDKGITPQEVMCMFKLESEAQYWVNKWNCALPPFEVIPVDIHYVLPSAKHKKK